MTGAVTYQGDNRQTKIQISETREMAKNRDGQSIFEGASRTERTYHLAGFEEKVIIILWWIPTH